MSWAFLIYRHRGLFMKKITKEEYLKEIELLGSKDRELRKKERELYKKCDDYGNLKEPYNSQYKAVWEEENQISKVLHAFKGLLENIKYDYFYGTYSTVINYLKDKYHDDIELLDPINDKAVFLLKNYVPYENDFPSIQANLNDIAYTDSDYFIEEIEEDIASIKEYFKDKKRNFIYVWEIEYLIFALYSDKVDKTNIVISTFGEPVNNEDKELQELNDNFDIVIKEIEENQKVHLSLYLWSIYKAYWYFHKKNDAYIYDNACFSLINKLLDSAFLFRDGASLPIIENPKTTYTGFAQFICALLANDLLNTLISAFPDYYDKNIMFLGYGLHIPGGCSSLSMKMDTFDNFLEGICDYDFWYGELDDTQEVMTNEFKINKDYESLKKNY